MIIYNINIIYNIKLLPYLISCVTQVHTKTYRCIYFKLKKN